MKETVDKQKDRWYNISEIKKQTNFWRVDIVKNKTKAIERVKVRDEVTRLEHFNHACGGHKSLRDKKRDRNSKQSKRVKNQLRNFMWC